MTNDLLQAVTEFVSLFELVFDDDWTYSDVMLREASGVIRGTFLKPDVDEQACNGENRFKLLESYRRLKTEFAKAGIAIVSQQCQVDPARSWISLPELLDGLENRSQEVYVREELDGKRGNYSLSELPASVAIRYVCQWIRQGFISSDERLQ